MCIRGRGICTPDDAKPSLHTNDRGVPKEGPPPVVGRRRTFTTRPGLALLLAPSKQGFIPEAPCCSGTPSPHPAPDWASLLEREGSKVPDRA